MRFKLDENLPLAAAEWLAAAGHDAETAVAEGLGGAADTAILEAASRERRILVTLDRGFADRRHTPTRHGGIVILRLADQRRARIGIVLERLLQSGTLDRLDGGVMVVGERRIRLRLGKPL